MVARKVAPSYLSVMENLLSTKLFYGGFACYGIALLLYFLLLGTERKFLLRAATTLMAIAFLLHTLGIVARTREFHHLPLANMYEYMLIAAWFAAAGYFVIIKFITSRFIGACTVTAVIMLMITAALLPKEGSSALMPALRSYWLYIHVTAAAASEGLFAIGCVSSVLYILKSALPHSSAVSMKIPDRAVFDTLTYRSIVIGYLLFTLGALFAGSVWAHRAWGSFWSWDPKETCSLVVWIIYSAYLHVRLRGKAGGLAPHFLSIAGFMAALLTFFASLFLGGLHSYG
jgi:cytochrome c-type biogenesis protein CcsB